MDSIFSNTKEAFTLKTNFELKRAKFLFKIIQNKFLVNIGTSLTNFSLKFHLPVTSIIKLTVFNHFCGGVSEIDCNPAIKKMFNKNENTQKIVRFFPVISMKREVGSSDGAWV